MEESEKSVYLNDVEYFSAKVEQNPSSALFVPLANAYIKLEKYDEAVATLTAGIDANPDVFSAKTLLAQAYMGQGNTDDARAILTEVMVVDKHNYLACKLMGDIERNAEDIKKALVNYRNALLLAPEDTKLREMMEELMEAAGIAMHEIQAEPSLMDADDEMLDQLGSELADEVRAEVGEAELGGKEASDEEVSSTVDSIVGVDEAGAADEMTLDNVSDSGSASYDDELEEELVASFDDEIVQTALSPDLPGEEDEDAGSAVKLDDEIMQSDGDAPAEEDVAALAAELGADLGLDIGEEPAEAPKDEVDEALDEVFSEEEEPEPAVDGNAFFEGVDTEQDELDDDLKAMLDGDEPEAVEQVEEEDPVAAALAEVESDAESAEEAGLDDDPVAAALAEIESGAEPAEEPELDDDLKALLGEDVAEEPAEEPVAEEENVVEAESFDELEAMLEGAEAASEEGEPEPVADMGTPEPEEPVIEVEEAISELAPEEPEDDEPTEEIYEASMDELMEPAAEDAEDEYENLPAETREQVNRLENLLETIKNNASK